jgi:hypothetical protein
MEDLIETPDFSGKASSQRAVTMGFAPRVACLRLRLASLQNPV